MKHTPAPWKLAGATTISNAEQTACIAHVSTFSIEQSEADANAALIAAAPELLAALEKVLIEYHGYVDPDRTTGQFGEWEEVIAARAAIAKAKGYA